MTEVAPQLIFCKPSNTFFFTLVAGAKTNGDAQAESSDPRHGASHGRRWKWPVLSLQTAGAAAVGELAALGTP